MSLAIPEDPRKIVRAPDPIAAQKSRYGTDPQTGRPVVKLFSGDWHVTTDPDLLIVTILGSCVAACIRDPIARVGGMNHFLLPSTDLALGKASDATRYGTYAMETLINNILKSGGRKERLEVKLFGGGNVTNNSARIGSKNAAFIREFMRNEGLNIVAQDLEGDLPRRVHYSPIDGKVLMRRLKRKEDFRVAEEEARYSRTLATQPIEGDIDLF